MAEAGKMIPTSRRRRVDHGISDWKLAGARPVSGAVYLLSPGRGQRSTRGKGKTQPRIFQRLLARMPDIAAVNHAVIPTAIEYAPAVVMAGRPRLRRPRPRRDPGYDDGGGRRPVSGLGASVWFIRIPADQAGEPYSGRRKSRHRPGIFAEQAAETATRSPRPRLNARTAPAASCAAGCSGCRSRARRTRTRWCRTRR